VVGHSQCHRHRAFSFNAPHLGPHHLPADQNQSSKTLEPGDHHPVDQHPQRHTAEFHGRTDSRRLPPSLHPLLHHLGHVGSESRNIAVLAVTPVTLDGMNYLQFENNHFSEYGVVSGTAMAPVQQQTYIVQPGDTLASIAAQFGVTVQSLAAANNIADLDFIYAGQTLIIA